MSANTKTPNQARGSDGEWRIRSAALELPLGFAFANSAGDASRLRQELAGVFVSRNPETFMAAGNYLETLARLDHFADEAGMMLRAGLSQDLAKLGLLGKGIIYAENLWNALQAAIEGIRYFQPGSTIRIGIRANRCHLTYSHTFGDGSAQALDVQYSIGVLCNILFESASLPEAGLHVRYPGAGHDHQCLFPNSVRLSDGAQAVLEFDSRVLRLPLRRSQPHLADLALSVIARLSRTSDSAPDYATLVGMLQSESLERHGKHLSLVETSSFLDCSTRMLQYRLREEGARFDRLRDAGRHEVARKAILAGQSINQVSHLVGFTHRQSFSEAFSRWEGMSPSEFRSRGRGQ